MKLKKILTIFIFSILSLTGIFFGCKDKYKDFSITINGENEITLYSGDSQSEDRPNYADVVVLIKNAPNNNCRILSYSVSQNNIVKIEELSSSSENVKQYRITALENISANRPTCEITFRSLEGEKECQLKVNVEIEVKSLSPSKSYTAYAVNDGKPYYIDISKAFNFLPANTTQRNVNFSLADESVKDYVDVSKSGAITVDPAYFEQSVVKSQIEIKAESADNAQIPPVSFFVNVLRDIKDDDIVLGYEYDGTKFSFSGDLDAEETKSILSLSNNGITLASNWDNRRNCGFWVEIKQSFGLTLEQINVGFEKLSLNNALIEPSNKNSSQYVSNFNIYSTNPGQDKMVVEISYKQFAGYAKRIEIPINVLEYPISLVVNNNSSKTSYDIFDFYKTNSLGQEFKIEISKAAAYNTNFKVEISQEQFNMLEISYLNEVLSFEDLTSRVFRTGTSLFVRAKNIDDEKEPVNIKFYSEIIEKNEDGELNVINKNLVKDITLNLVPGIRTLSFEVGSKDQYYLEKDEKNELEIPFVINLNANSSLFNYVSLEFVKGSNLVDIIKDGCSFILKSKGVCGEVEFYLKSDSEIETSTKKVIIYSGYNEDKEQFSLNLDSNNIKNVTKHNEKGEEITVKYIGTTFGKNTANFKIENPQNASIYDVVANSSNDAVKVAVLNKNDLTFSLVATENVKEKITISVIIKVYKNFDEINTSAEIFKEIELDALKFDLYTYKPIDGVTFKNGELSQTVTLIDGEALDIDSLAKQMNMLDIASLIDIQGDSKDVYAKLNMPSYLIEDEYEPVLDSQGNPTVSTEHDFGRTKDAKGFDKLYFHTAKNHKFVNNQLVFGITIEIFDLEGSDENYLLTLKVVLTKQVEPEKVIIKNTDGYIYISNTSVDFEQINAEVIGKNGNEATNKSLSYEIKEGTSVSVDANGVLTVVSAGVTKIRVYAKASKYFETGDYSKYADVYVVVADGSKSFPYILKDVKVIDDNKFYCLENDIVVNNQISKNIAGLSGKNAYAKYSTTLSENSVYNLIYNATGSVFANKNEALIENLNIIYNQNKIDVSEDFGLISKENAGTVKNVNLIINNLQIENNFEVTGSLNYVGLMFAFNSGSLENCSVNSIDNQIASVVLSKNACNFGGIVGKNNGDIVGNFNFLSDSVDGMINLKIVDNTIGNHFVGGVAAENFGKIEGVKVNLMADTSANIVGGIVAKSATGDEYKNLYFSGKIISKKATNVGGIAGVVESETSFKLVFVEFVQNNDAIMSEANNSVVGGIVGTIGEKTSISFAYAKSFNQNGEYNLSGNIAGGIVGRNDALLSLNAVYSDLSLESVSESGAFVAQMNGDIEIENAYSYASGASLLIGKRESGNLLLNKVYSTTCEQSSETGDNIKYFFGKANYSKVTSIKYDGTDIFVFNDDKYFRYSSLENNGRPYLVYNNADGYKKLMTIVASSIDAKLVVKNSVLSENSGYRFGAVEDIIVIEDNTLDKAVIYFKNNLEFDVDEILNVNVTPRDAMKDFVITSSNNQVISITKNASGLKLKVLATGDCTLTISARHNESIKTYIYLSVIEKIENFEFENSITISNKSTKQIDYKLSEKTSKNGVMFNLNSACEEKILVNNMMAQNNQIFCFDSTILITALDTFETKILVAPFVSVKFGDDVFNFVDMLNQKEVSVIAVNNASVISSTVNYFAIPENESLKFEVFVDCSNENQDLIFESLDGENLSQYFDFKVSYKTDATKNETIFEVDVKANSLNLANDKLFDIKILHKIGDVVNENISQTLQILLKSSLLKGVELNHYSSTIYYYNNYDYIINKETTPSFAITKGNLGVLTINLYPSFANITEVEISSSIVNGNRINFSQLKLNDNNTLSVVPHKSNLYNGIKLKLESDEIKKNGGNLYVSTLLSSNVLDDTVFAITVTCYYGFGQKYDPVTINLTAKALTTIILSNENGDENFYVAKGSFASLKINAINMQEDFAVDLSNFVFKIDDRELVKASLKDSTGFEYFVDTQTNSIFGFKVENGKLLVFSDLMNERNTKLSILPVYKTTVNGKETTNEGVKIDIRVVDFVVNNVFADKSESGILTNYLGNSTMLKADFDANYCLDIYYRDDNDMTIESYSYVNENGENVSINFNFVQRQLELSNILLKINLLKEQISKSNYSWNVITKNSSGNLIYNNIKDNTSYSNFVVNVDADGYYNIFGKIVSENRMLLKVNLSYENGTVKLNQNSNIELTTEFVLNIKTESSLDNPTPISTSEEFLTKLEDGGNYILLSNITLPATFGGIDAKIASFDGNNKTINIEGFSLANANQTSLGLFNVIDENAIIKNVTINILPTLFYSDAYYYGLNVNAQACASLNFGVLCGTNNGIITNCKVINNNIKLVNKENVYKLIYVNVNASEESDIKIGALVGQNNGYITHSSVGDAELEQQLAISSKAVIGGLCGENNKKIASSYVVNIAIYNNSKTKITAGFVAINQVDAQITTSYVQGFAEKPNEIKESLLDGGIFANGYVGGFATTNAGTIKDCFANVKITTNKRSSGFVYDNTNGYVETSISASSASNSTQSYRNFVGNNEENIVLNNQGIKYCYYISNEDLEAGEGEYDEPANAIMGFDDASYFEGFICDGTSSSVWRFDGFMPKPVDANQKIISERKLLNDISASSKTEKYEYIYINNDIGSINNPIIVGTTEQFFDALTNENNLYSYYYSGKVQKTQINYKNISIVKDLDLSKIIDKNNNEINTTSEVQKLQDIIFAGSLNGNGMLLENITITAKNDKIKYSSFGLFKQIGVENTYNLKGEIDNSYLDEDNCSVIKNAKFEIDGISATITRNVGTLSGEVINSKLYNINIYSNNNVRVEGNNIVGGVAGRISGNSFVKGVSSNLSVKATFENKTSNYEYVVTSKTKVFANANQTVQDDLNQEVNIVGGLFGVVDIYKVQLDNFVQKAGTNSYYVDATIIRENDFADDNANILFTTVGGDIKIEGDIVGGMFGYVESGSKIYDARFVLNESGTQNLVANYAVGGICGINKGFITYSTVETTLTRQREIDKNQSYTASYLFSNENNKATFVGGLVGILDGGYLSYSYNKANIVATQSKFVGAAVGAFSNAKIDYVYANAYVEAQKEVTENGLVTTEKGYAGFIGTITSFANESFITHAVSILRNNIAPDGFEIAGMVGYNNAKNVKISGEYSSNVNFVGSENVVNGIDLDFENSKLNAYTYNDYINQLSSTFSGYSSSSSENRHWVRTKDLDTYYRLSYNKKGAVKEVADEDALRSLTKNGKYVLTSDIYLTSVWDPISVFSGEFTSAKRKDRAPGQSEYYIIYNLTINSSSKNVSGDVGFFVSTSNATISNITFVVGSNYVDPQDGSDPSNIDANWGNGTSRGIRIINNQETNHNLGVLSGFDEASTVSNFTVRIENNDEININTNLDVVGAVFGKANKTKISSLSDEGGNGVCVDNIALKRTSNKINKNDIFVGGIVGKATQCEIENIYFKRNVKIGNHQAQQFNNGYIGAVCGYANISSIKDVKINGDGNSLEIDHTVDIDKNVIGEKIQSSIYSAIIAGYGAGTTAEDIVVENTIVNTKNNYRRLSNIYAGAVFGCNKSATNYSNNVKNVVLKSSASINVEDNANDYTDNSENSELSKNNFIGGISGTNEGGQITNVNSALKLRFFTALKIGNTFFGGIVGKNGDANVRGATISNVICKQILSVTHKSKNIYAGGIVGFNNNNGEKKENISDTLFIGSLKYFCDSLKFIGGIVGNNGNISENSEEKNNYTNCYFVEDLSLTPKRNIEFGNPVSFKDFVGSKISEFFDKNDDNKVWLLNNDEAVTEISGDKISFEEGSVYKPKEINSFEALKACENGKYYCLQNDLDLTEFETIDELKGNIIGNGHVITLSKGFAKTIDTDALITDLIFNLVGEDETYNNKNFVNTTNYIVAETLNGTLYNSILKGNLAYGESEIAPVAITNSGFVNVVTSYANIIAKNMKNASTKVSGFVCENKGVIYNSIATGVIEVMDETQYSVYKQNNNSEKVAGFVYSNSDIISNCVSAVSLPLAVTTVGTTVTETVNYSFRNSGSGVSNNCYVDVFANGNYKVPDISDETQYLLLNEINEELKKSAYSSLWQESNAGVLFGYRFPVLSVFAGSKNILNTLATTEKDNKNNTIYHVNNFSSLRNVIELLNGDSSNDSSNDSSDDSSNNAIYIKLLNSFAGAVKKQGENDIFEYIENSSIKLSKVFNLNGNNYVIYNYYLENKLLISTKNNPISEADKNASEDYENAYLGLFWSEKETDSSTIAISITNLALKNATIKINTVFKDDSGNLQALKNIYVGAFVATAKGKVNISGCYVDGTIECVEQTDTIYFASGDTDGNNIVIGGFVGEMNQGGTIGYCISKLNIFANYLTASLSYNNKVKKSGFNANVGGIVGLAKNATILCNYVFGNVSISSVKSLNLGGIVGNAEKITILQNVMFGQVYYKGAYLGYYASSDDETKYYNINAIAGLYNKTIILNYYNHLISLTYDGNLASTPYQTMKGYANAKGIKNTNPFVENDSVFEKTIYEEITIDKSNSNNLDFESNKTYIVSTQDSQEITFDESNSEKDLENTTIIFENNAKAKISKNIFKSLKNCTIANLTVYSNGPLTTSAIAKKIENTKLYNINLKNIQFKRTDSVAESENVGANATKNINVGAVVDHAVSSMLFKVKVELGRLEYNVSNGTEINATHLNVGGIVGFGQSTLLSECENSATITTSFGANISRDDFTIGTAGLMGQSDAGYIFGSKNSGLVYAKNLKNKNIKTATSSITNTYANSNVISFCQNSGKIKGVNKYQSTNVKNNVAGISAGSDVILYCYNKNNVTAISSTTSSKDDVATGVGGGSVYYSYFMGGVVSSSTIYSITNGSAYYCYSIGSGYTAGIMSGSSTNLCHGGENNVGPADDKFRALTPLEKAENKEYWFVTFTKDNPDMGVSHEKDYVDDDGNITDWKDTTVNSNFVRPTIMYFNENEFSLSVNENNEYEISSAFELWYWSKFVCGSSDKNVVLTEDIDMTGYTWKTPKSNSKVINGKFHTISNLTIESTTNGDDQLWGFVGENNGTIQNINFENPSVQIIRDTTQNSGNVNLAVPGSNFISIVSAINKGTIDSILVGQVDEGSSFININYIVDTPDSNAGHQQADLYIGVISGRNENTIDNVEVINLSAPAINSYIMVGRIRTFAEYHTMVHAGGIVGENKKTLNNGYYISSIISELKNQTYYGVGDEWLFGLYSYAKQDVGQIFGKNSGSFTDCYSPKGDKFKFVLTENLYGANQVGAAKSEENGDIDNFAPLKTAAKAGPGFAVAAMVPTITGKAIAAVVVGGWTIFQLSQQSSSWHQAVNISGTADEYGGNGIELKNEDGTYTNDAQLYLSRYIAGFEDVEICKEVLNLNKLPYSSSFVDLSSAKTKPEIYNNDTYLVYNINELAYALTDESSSISKIELMDNINMTKKVWNYGAGEIRTDLTIVDNGFKIVYGNNSNFKKEFDEAYNKNNENILKETTEEANEYGKFDSVTKNQNKAAIENFEIRFSEVWKDEFKKQTGASDAYADERVAQIITKENGETTYTVEYSKQLEVIADAMANYTIDGITTHTAINFSGTTIKIADNLTMPDNILALDRYKFGDNVPDFVAKDSKISIDQTLISSYAAFKGTIDGGNNMITLTSNNLCLLYNSFGNVKNLHINATDITEIDTSKEKFYNEFATFGILFNYGTMNNLTISTNQTIILKQETIKFADSNRIVNINKNDKIISAYGEIIFGVFAAENYGSIENCTIDTNNQTLNLAIKHKVDYAGMKNVKELDGLEDLTGYSLDMIYNATVGMFSATNSGIIKYVNVYRTPLNISFNDLNSSSYIKENGSTYMEVSENTGNDGDAESGSGSNKYKISVNKVLNAGIISGKNSYSYGYTEDTEGKNGVVKCSVIDSKITFDGSIEGGNIGVISGYSELGISDCKVLNSVNTTKTDAEKGVFVGSLCGSISPALVEVKNKELVAGDYIYGTPNIYTVYTPSFKNNITQNQEWFGQVLSLKIGKLEEKTYKDTKIKVSEVSQVSNNTQVAEKVINYVQYFFEDANKDIVGDVETKDNSVLVVVTNSDNKDDYTKTFDIANINYKTLTLKAYYEHKVGEEVIGNVACDALKNIKLKLTLKVDGKLVNDIYCYAENGTILYVSYDINDINEINNIIVQNVKNSLEIELVDDEGNKIEKDGTGQENLTVTINGQIFTANITSKKVTEILDEKNMLLGYKYEISYSNLEMTINYEKSQKLSDLTQYAGFKFYKSGETDPLKGETPITDIDDETITITANYSYQTYIIQNIKIKFNQLKTQQ